MLAAAHIQQELLGRQVDVFGEGMVLFGKSRPRMVGRRLARVATLNGL